MSKIIKKTFIFTTLLSGTLLLANNSASILSIKDINNRDARLSNTGKNQVKYKVNTLFKKVDGNGKSTIQLIINNKTHKIDKIIIFSKYGDMEFKKDFREFLKYVNRLRFQPISSKSKTLKFKMELTASNQKEISYSLYKNSKKDMYMKYIKFLIKEKKYTRTEIREMLDSNKDTVSKTLLLAIYYDYMKDDIEQAQKYYKAVVKQSFSRFKRKEEGLFLADFLIREGYDTTVLKIFPRYSCEFFKEQEEMECQYFRAKALYNLNDPKYIIPLNQVKDKLKPAYDLYQYIKKENGIR